MNLALPAAVPESARNAVAEPCLARDAAEAYGKAAEYAAAPEVKAAMAAKDRVRMLLTEAAVGIAEVQAP